MAQNHMKQQVDQHRSRSSFEVVDQVFLRLQQYKQTSHKPQGHQKLAPNFYGPYRVIQCIGPVAYELDLPTSYKIFFHQPQWATQVCTRLLQELVTHSFGKE